MENENSDDKFYFDEMVDVVNKQTLISQNAKIESIRGSVIVIRYTISGKTEILNIDDNLVIKQCKSTTLI